MSCSSFGAIPFLNPVGQNASGSDSWSVTKNPKDRQTNNVYLFSIQNLKKILFATPNKKSRQQFRNSRPLDLESLGRRENSLTFFINETKQKIASPSEKKRNSKTIMIFPIKAENDLLMMDDTDFREHMLLNCLETDKQESKLDDQMNSSSAPSLLEEESPEDEDNEFLNNEKIGEISSKGATLGNQESSEKCKESSTTAKTEQKRETVDPSKVEIPSKFDILCGQSRICANHTGNRRFQIVLDIYAPKYDVAQSKNEKMALTKEIVGCIASSGGRFLKYKDGVWIEISTVTARDKVSHALRTKVASWKRQQEQKELEEKAGSSVGTPKKRPTHRRRSSSKRRRSSTSSIVTNASDIMTSSFDGNDSATSSVMDELLKTQREIFASLTQGKKVHPLKK